MKKYLFFVIVEGKTEVTNRWVIGLEKRPNVRLGEIYWFRKWKKYVFVPDNDTVWAKGCLTEVIEFIDDLTKRRC